MSEFQNVKAKLEARLRELDDRAHKIDDELRKPGDADWSENAVESENDEALEEIGHLAVDETRKLKAALRKIDAGTYGICESCGVRIAAKRLEALPYATNCIDCA